MDKQARIQRISLMEDRYDEVTRVLATLEEAVHEYEDFKSELDALKDYMESGEWKEDYEADEAGQLPSDLKRGILSTPTRSSPTSRKCSPTNNPPGCHGLAQTMTIFAL